MRARQSSQPSKKPRSDAAGSSGGFARLSRLKPPLDGPAPPTDADFVRIRAGNPGPMTLSGTNTYVVSREPAWVIDPGPEDSRHIDAVRAEAETRGGIGGVLLTHSHADHSAGVAPLGSPLVWGKVSEGDELRPPPTPTDVADAPGSGAGDISSPAEVAGTHFVAIPTPGHAADHVAFVWREVCFCGDLILGEGSTIVPPAAFGGSLGDYLESLKRLRGVEAMLLAPGHGPWITDPRTKIDEYLAHRAERERKLLAAIDKGERSRDALLEAAWDDVPDVLRGAAALAMQAHLEKLEADGRLDSSELTG